MRATGEPLPGLWSDDLACTGGGGGTEAERWARAALAAVTEPGDRTVWTGVATHGALQVLAWLHDGGSAPDGFAVPERYRARAALADPAVVRERSDAAGARLLVPWDHAWPVGLDLLGELTGAQSAPPLALWVRGAGLDTRRDCTGGDSTNPAGAGAGSSGDELRVALVGARAATAYGVEVATSLGFDLAERGVGVVSGAAYGIDGAAHRGALAAGGLTIAVLASGVDRAYPAGHEALIERIAREGAVLSEAPPGAHPTKSRFLTRNRIIAALSEGVVVVEAALRSGALNTAHWATQLSRHVMAVPGPVSSSLSAGPHRAVIDRGAALVTDSADVLELVSSAGDALQTNRRGEERPIDHLPASSVAVLEAMPARAGRDVGQLAVAAGVPVDVALGALSALAAEGWVERTASGWRRSRLGSER